MGRGIVNVLTEKGTQSGKRPWRPYPDAASRMGVCANILDHKQWKMSIESTHSA